MVPQEAAWLPFSAPLLADICSPLLSVNSARVLGGRLFGNSDVLGIISATLILGQLVPSLFDLLYSYYLYISRNSFSYEVIMTSIAFNSNLIASRPDSTPPKNHAQADVLSRSSRPKCDQMPVRGRN
jgi:hypothetical protein